MLLCGATKRLRTLFSASRGIKGLKTVRSVSWPAIMCHTLADEVEWSKGGRSRGSMTVPSVLGALQLCWQMSSQLENNYDLVLMGTPSLKSSSGIRRRPKKQKRKASEGQRFCSGAAKDCPSDSEEDQAGNGKTERVGVERAFRPRKT